MQKPHHPADLCTLAVLAIPRKEASDKSKLDILPILRGQGKTCN